MAPTTKGKPSPAPASADRTSTVVTSTLILLTLLGVVTVFWEPLAALAVGAPAAESVGESRGPAADAGSVASPSVPSAGTTAPAGVALDGSTSS